MLSVRSGGSYSRAVDTHNRAGAVVLLALALGTLLASSAQARVPGIGEHRAVQESLSRVHPRMRASWLRERGIEDPYYTAVRRPDSGRGLVEVGRWSYGPSYDVDGRTTPSETLVALARGSGVSLLRFSRQDSLSIQLLADINAEGLMCRVKVVDTLLYVGSRKGLEIYNIADEQNPARLSWTPIPLNDFVLQDSLVYTISGDDSFRVYNVSNPFSPVFRGACVDSGDVVSAAGNTAFLGQRWGLYVIDVSNPANPHRVGSWGSAVEQVQARGHLCYVTTFDQNGEPPWITFHILDVTVPANPYQVGSLDSVGGYGVYLVDTLAYCSGDADLPEFSIVSLADSTRPYALSMRDVPGWGWGAWASGLAQAAFIGCHRAGLQVFDTRNTVLPVRDTGLLGADQAVDVDVDGGRAYVADYNAGLQILDVSVPSRPMLLAQYDSSRTVRSATARDSFAYVSWPMPRMVTLDVTDPHHPLRVAGCDGMFNPPEDMVLRDSFVYCAEMNRFQIVNVARPRQPVLVGSCVSTDGVYFGLAVQDTLAYVAGGASLEVVSVADPANPRVIDSGGRASSGVTVKDTFAYIPYPYDTLFVYSVADPSNFRLLSAVPASVWPWDAVLGESRVYVGAGNGIDVYILSNPAQPHHAGSVSPADGVRRLSYAGGLLYAALWEGGVAIYETTSVGVQEQSEVPEKQVGLRVWPSVAPGRVRFEVGAAARASDVEVFDVSGKRLRDVPLRADTKGGATNGVIDLAGLAAGVYVIRVESVERSFTAKVVKTNRR
ncbi:MAG TPA: T9SS type A sorting domain-containing protein [bacterium]|nr:T9SS type A sorting domain-containing protein [bacterium]